MKKYIIIPLIFLFILLFSCSKKELNVTDLNSPTLLTLNTEAGIIQAALGMYGYYVTNNGNDQVGGLLSYDFDCYSLTNHEILGDAVFVPWGNFGWRWINGPYQITYTSTYNNQDTTVITPNGKNQQAEIGVYNTRAQGDNNSIMHEWMTMYVLNNNSNLIISKLIPNSVTFLSGGTTKTSTLLAWAYFWKGYAYSRIGSFYQKGLCTNVYSNTNNNYVTHQAMIDSATVYYNKAITLLKTIPDGDPDFATVVNGAIPSYYYNTQIQPSSWIRNINTLMARNILVNNYPSNLATSDWQNIVNLTANGIQSGDFNFVIVPDPIYVNFDIPYNVTDNGVWAFISERLVQDFKDTALDARFHRYVTTENPPLVNVHGRGIQFGTRWTFVDGTNVASSTLLSNTYAPPFVYVGATYEENLLMEAEANIYSNNINNGLTFVDAVRDYQTSGLKHVSGTGLTQAQALNEVRIERRIGLILRGLPFYDARRWQFLDPSATGTGRTGCWLLDANGNFHNNANIDYQYYEWYPVPTNETDLNPMSNAKVGAVY